jgi:hypothetical protein
VLSLFPVQRLLVVVVVGLLRASMGGGSLLVEPHIRR